MPGYSRRGAFLAASSPSMRRAPLHPPLHLPLDRSPGGVLTTALYVDDHPFRLIVDSGSPYLLLPAEEDCDAQPPKLSLFGCAPRGRFRAAGLPPTREQYGAAEGRVEWCEARVRWGRARGVPRVTFGAADREVMRQSGGALLGLIREVDPAEGRPTALAQLGANSFRVDARRMRLTLSHAALLPAAARDTVRLDDPRGYGAGVRYVCCRVEGDQFRMNGRLWRTRRPLLCVFDSGLTGCVASKSLVDELELNSLIAEVPRRSARVQSIELALRREDEERVVLRSSLSSSPLFYVQSVRLNWFADARSGPHIFAVGQCMLGNGELTVDWAQGRARWV
ncbi:hypothetical protein AB1Y20_000917 [Prymnesium parvum]|uniref:Peptidase A1 domain-containing protein n=1 Tax=Prymnesium parvum TaxID=97485 RepID=A0AB34KAH9_PRYPA